MTAFTHEQAQEILRSGGEASDFDREGLTAHLSRCSDCQAYAALVDELGQVVPRMYPVSLLSAQEIHRKVSASQPMLRRQSMYTQISRGTRTLIWLGASLALVLGLIILSPRLIPNQTGGNPTLTPLVSVSSTPASEINATPKPGQSIQYTVAAGENLFGIAEKFGLKPETILWANPDKLADKPKNIKPGIVLRIPAEDGLYYRWQAGDTIAAIASRYGVAPADILTWLENAAQIGPVEKPDILPGMLLFIPGGKMPLQPVPELPAAHTPTPEGKVSDIELSALLKIFPLVPGTNWTYTEEYYSQDGSDPNTLLHAVTAIDERVIEAGSQPPYYFAHIQVDTTLVSADPGWQDTGGLGLGTQDFWYVVQGGKVYLSVERPDPANLALDQLSEELDFPMTVGLSWCPNKIQKGSLTPVAETPVPCAYAGARQVLSEGPYKTQAGSFDRCFQMSDYYNSGGPVKVFCDGIGIVAETYNHSGTRFGSSKELVQYNHAPPISTPSAPTAPAAVSQVGAETTWGKGAITASEYSPDGRRLGVVTTQGVTIYDAARLQQLDFIPNGSAASTVAFSPDWSLLATGSGSTISLLRLADRIEIAHLETDQGKVARLLFSPDGRYLASLVQPPGDEVYTKILDLWGVPDGKLLGTWEAGVMPDLAFTPDSQSLYAWYPDTMAGTHHWQIPSGEALPVLNEIFPRGVAFAPDGNLDVSTNPITEPPVMRVHSLADGTRLRTLIWEQTGFSGSLFYTPDGALLVGISNGGPGKVWRVKDGVLLRIFNTSVTKDQLMAVSPDSQSIALSAADGLVFYNLADGQISRRLQSHPQSIRQAALSPQGDRVAALLGDSDPEKISLAMWAYPQEQPIYLLPRIAAVAALDLAWSPPGDRLALASWDGRILILNSTDGSLVQTLPGHAQQVQSVAWSPDGAWIASASFSVKVWQVSDGTLLSDLSGSGQWITDLVFSPDGKLLAGTDADGKIDVWNLTERKRVVELPLSMAGAANPIAFVPGSGDLAVADQGRLWFYHPGEDRSFRQVSVPGGSSVLSLCLSPDGTYLAAGTQDGQVLLWQQETGQLLQTLQGGFDGISSVGFTSDGQTLMAASRDGTLHFWKIQK